MTLQLLDMRLKKLSTYPQKERRKEKRTKKEKKKEKLRLLTVNFFQDGPRNFPFTFYLN